MFNFVSSTDILVVGVVAMIPQCGVMRVNRPCVWWGCGNRSVMRCVLRSSDELRLFVMNNYFVVLLLYFLLRFFFKKSDLLRFWMIPLRGALGIRAVVDVPQKRQGQSPERRERSAQRWL